MIKQVFCFILILLISLGAKTQELTFRLVDQEGETVKGIEVFKNRKFIIFSAKNLVILNVDLNDPTTNSREIIVKL
jgi:hypothetical protein